MMRSLRTSVAAGALAASLLLALPAEASPVPRFVTSISASIKLGSVGATGYAQAISQSPSTNDVYFAEGAKIFVVVGNASPVRLVTAKAPVLALCATSADLFVETSSSIAEYTIPAAAYVGEWAIPTGLGPSKDTQAGISVVGANLWTWTDWEDDQSGYEFGSVVQYSLTNWSHRVLDKGQVNPGDAAADPFGYFFLANDHVVRAEPSGALRTSAKTPDASDAPMAVLGSAIYLVATREPAGKDYLDSFTVSGMALVRSVPVTTYTYGILGTPLGLVGIADHGSSKTANNVVLIDPSTGAETNPLHVSGAQGLLYGTTLSAVADVGNEIYLDRLG